MARTDAPLLQIPRHLYAAILDHCLAEVPREAVGLLTGRAGTVTRAWALWNAHPRPEGHFRVDPVDLQTAESGARAAGGQLLAVYHSHPDTVAYPSAEDLRLAPPELHLLIISLATAPPDVRAYRSAGGAARAVPFRLLDAAGGEWVDLRPSSPFM